MDGETNRTKAARRELIAAAIYELALHSARVRLETISEAEREDNIAFDRAARTAQIFVRTACEVDALLARHEAKAEGAHAKREEGPPPTEEEIAETAREVFDAIVRSDERFLRAGVAGGDGDAA